MKRKRDDDCGVYKRLSGTYRAAVTVGGKLKLGTCRKTKAEAVADRDKLKLKQEAVIEQRKKKATRETNLATYGGSCAKERDEAWLISMLVRVKWEVVVLNDGTDADIIVRPVGAIDDMWLPIQLKTKNRSTDDSLHWQFSDSKGYARMAILFWTLDANHVWVLHDGAKMTTTGPVLYEKDKKPNGTWYKWNKVMKETRCTQSPSDVCAALAAAWAACPWRVTNWVARHDLSSDKMRTEMRGIDAWVECVKPATWSWPKDQNGEYDLRVDDALPRKQFKTPFKETRKCGYHVHLRKSAGAVNGKPTKRPYDEKDFDELVIVLVDEVNNWVDVWTISRNVLLAKGYLKTATCKGVTTINIHLPKHLTDERPRVEGVRGKPCKTLWTRDYHARFEKKA